MNDSIFRDSLTYLRDLTGGHIEWPQLARHLIDLEFKRVIRHGIPYGGKNVFIDRDARAWKYRDHRNQNDEEILVYSLYRMSHQNNNGCIELAKKKIWLVSCQVPNQAKHRGRRADLVGLRKDGSVVLFECKVRNNGRDTPLSSLMEGLDYLSHLLLPGNINNFNKGLAKWRKKVRKGEFQTIVPAEFKDVEITSKARHAVTVLAPSEYYDYHMTRRNLPQQWHLLSDRYWPKGLISAEIDFATSNYTNEPCNLLELS